MFFLFYLTGEAQIVQDTTHKVVNYTDSALRIMHKVVNYADSALRIRNINPYFTLHVDSTLRYAFDINKDQSQYFWYLKNTDDNF